MTPDKIYVHKKDNPIEITWSEIKEKDCQNVEYIRKDALLEWAKEKQYESLTIVADNFWQEVIDKIQSL